MSFSRVLGQDQPIQIIRKALQNNRAAHTYLFYGQESVGKKLTALELAKAVNCQVSGPGDGCDQCPSCRKIDRGIHPDFFLLEPLKSSPTAKETVIKIDAARELQKKLIYFPYEGKTKVAIIDSAEKMNPQAANSLLKTLEEPPTSTILILIAPNPFQLLPTIVSRCQGIKFSPLSPANIQRILEEKRLGDSNPMSQEEIELRSLRSTGRVDRALEEDLVESGKYRQELLDLIADVSFDRMDTVFNWPKAWARQPDRLNSVLDELLNLLHDLALLKTQCDAQSVYNKDLLGRLKPLSAEKSLPALLKMFDSVHHTKSALSANLNTQLTLENMLIKFCEAA